MYGIPLYGVNLLKLARLVGIRQIDIARHLGVTKMQPTYWARGQRPIPRDTVAPLVAFIAKAVQKRLADAAPWDTIRADLTTALRACFVEHCQRHVHMPEPSLEAFMAEVEKYAALTQRQQQQGPRIEDMERLSAAMLSWFQVHAALLPLLRLLEGAEVAVEDTEEKGRKVHR